MDPGAGGRGDFARLVRAAVSKAGLWKLPGDLRFTHKRREYFLPITSTVLLSVALTLLLRVFGR